MPQMKPPTRSTCWPCGRRKTTAAPSVIFTPETTTCFFETPNAKTQNINIINKKTQTLEKKRIVANHKSTVVFHYCCVLTRLVRFGFWFFWSAKLPRSTKAHLNAMEEELQRWRWCGALGKKCIYMIWGIYGIYIGWQGYIGILG